MHGGKKAFTRTVTLVLVVLLPFITYIILTTSDITFVEQIFSRVKSADKNLICPQKQRMAYLHKYCLTSSIDYTNMSYSELQWLTQVLTVSDNLKTIACIHYKVGYETLTAILVNNSADAVLPTEAYIPSIESQYLKKLSDYSQEEINYRLKNYFKFMFVRHPLERILSGWRDKLVIEMRDHHGNYYKHLLPKILKGLHPELLEKDLDKIRIPFNALLNWLMKGGSDMHFHGPYDHWCHPCAIQYDYIGKTETFEEDVSYIVNKHMKGRGQNTRRNSWGQLTDDGRYFVKELEEYKNVSDFLLTFLSEKYYKDFYQFGYTWKRSKGSVIISCKDKCC